MPTPEAQRSSTHCAGKPKAPGNVTWDLPNPQPLGLTDLAPIIQVGPGNWTRQPRSHQAIHLWGSQIHFPPCWQVQGPGPGRLPGPTTAPIPETLKPSTHHVGRPKAPGHETQDPPNTLPPGLMDPAATMQVGPRTWTRQPRSSQNPCPWDSQMQYPSFGWVQEPEPGNTKPTRYRIPGAHGPPQVSQRTLPSLGSWTQLPPPPNWHGSSHLDIHQWVLVCFNLSQVLACAGWRCRLALPSHPPTLVPV